MDNMGYRFVYAPFFLYVKLLYEVASHF
uniref:Uncharacterized protein n=1 Tax=Rhizophora mucronata TaxID=61149 RepID=A0A2P2JET3_RHIMU